MAYTLYIDVTKDLRNSVVESTSANTIVFPNTLVFGDLLDVEVYFTSNNVAYDLPEGNVQLSLGQPGGTIYAYTNLVSSSGAWVGSLNLATAELNTALGSSNYIPTYLQVTHTDGASLENVTYAQQKLYVYNNVISSSLFPTDLPEYLTVSESDQRYLRQGENVSGSMWLNTGNYVYTSTSSYQVGIGTATPSEKLEVVGNIKVTSGTVKGNLTGTASWASAATWAQDCVLAQVAETAQTADYATSAGSAISASYVQNVASSSYSITSSYSTIARDCDFANWCITADVATTASYTYYTDSALSSSYATFAKDSVSSSYAVTASYIATASYVRNALTASYAFTSSYTATNVLNITSSTSVSASFATSSLTSSYLKGNGSYINPTYQDNGIYAYTDGGSLVLSGSDFTRIYGYDFGVEAIETSNITVKQGSLTIRTGNILVLTGSRQTANNLRATGSLLGTASYATTAATASSVHGVSPIINATDALLINGDHSVDITTQIGNIAIASAGDVVIDSGGVIRLDAISASIGWFGGTSKNALTASLLNATASYAKTASYVTNNAGNYIEMSQYGGDGITISSSAGSMLIDIAELATFNFGNLNLNTDSTFIVKGSSCRLSSSNASVLVSSAGVALTGSKQTANNLQATGSLFGTAKVALEASNSLFLGGHDSNFFQPALVVGSVYPITSSWSVNSLLARTSSYADVAVTAGGVYNNDVVIYAGNEMSISTNTSNIIISSPIDIVMEAGGIVDINHLVSADADLTGNITNADQAISSSYAVTSSYSTLAENANNADFLDGYNSSEFQLALVTGNTYNITSSWANNSQTSVSSSYASNASTSDNSDLLEGHNSDYFQPALVLAGTYPITASWSNRTILATSSSYASNASTSDNSDLLEGHNSDYFQPALVLAGTYPITSSWAVNATNALTAALANYATDANHATSADDCQNAQYAINAGTAGTASYWNSSSLVALVNTKQDALVTGGTYSITSSWAVNATNALTATNAGTAGTASYWNSSSLVDLVNTKQNTLVTGGTYSITSSWATNAVSATSATTATTSTTATSASHALHALYADTAGDANTLDGYNSAAFQLSIPKSGNTYLITSSWALQANVANDADHSTYSDDALSAIYAVTAGSASYALTSTTAVSASYAPSSPSVSSSYSTYAENAGNADFLDGYNSGEFQLDIPKSGNTYLITASWVANGGTTLSASHALKSDLATTATSAVYATDAGYATAADEAQSANYATSAGSAGSATTATTSSLALKANSVQLNSVALGTDTTGNYASRVSAGSNIAVGGTPGEGTNYTVSLNDTISLSRVTATEITGALNGDASTAGYASTAGHASTATSASYAPPSSYNTATIISTTTMGYVSASAGNQSSFNSILGTVRSNLVNPIPASTFSTGDVIHVKAMGTLTAVDGYDFDVKLVIGGLSATYDINEQFSYNANNAVWTLEADIVIGSEGSPATIIPVSCLDHFAQSSTEAEYLYRQNGIFAGTLDTESTITVDLQYKPVDYTVTKVMTCKSFVIQKL